MGTLELHPLTAQPEAAKKALECSPDRDVGIGVAEIRAQMQDPQVVPLAVHSRA